jgi:hypothetical protein
MAMIAPVHVENVGRLFGSNQPISAHFTAFNSSDQLQQKRFDLYKEAPNTWGSAMPANTSMPNTEPAAIALASGGCPAASSGPGCFATAVNKNVSKNASRAAYKGANRAAYKGANRNSSTTTSRRGPRTSCPPG